MLLQGPSYEADPGTNVKFDLSKNKRERQVFQIGAFARLSNHYQKTVSFNDLIVTTRFDYNNVGLGFSYDINTSEFNAATNGNGGFEFNLMYKICDGFKRADYCPNF